MTSQPRIASRNEAFGKAALYVQTAALVVSIVFMITAVFLLVGSISGTNREYLAAAGGTCAAGAGVFFAAWQYGRQDAASRSSFALQMAMDGVRRAYAIIDISGPATRIQWVNAGRVMSRATQTSKNIRERDHKDAWDQFREEWRIKFFHFLTRSPEYYLGLAEPADFDPTKIAYLDEKLIELLKQTEIKSRFAMQSSSGSGTSNSYLSLKSIKPIYDFAQYDDEWRDPLGTVQDFTAQDKKAMMNRDMKGLSLTIYARNKWTVFGSKVIETNKINAGYWKPEDILDDDEI